MMQNFPQSISLFRRFFKCALIVFFTVLSPVVSAQSEGVRFAPYIGIGVGLGFLDPDVSEAGDITVTEDEQTGFQLTLGLDINQWLSLEFHRTDLGSAEFSNDGTIDYVEYGVSALIYAGNSRGNFVREGWNAYGRAGVADIVNDSSDGLRFDGPEGVDWVLGAGAEYATGSGFGVRAEGMVFSTNANYLQLGVVYRFGRLPGFLSSRFANAGASEVQDENGLVATERSPASDDANAEGDVDTRNSENTEAIAGADSDDDASNSENADADEDGIVTGNDRCPDTPPGIAVDDNGCAVFTGIVEGLTFVSGSADLTQSAQAVLDTIAETMRQTPEVRARVSAHTDAEGDSELNLRLSRLRALSVSRYLVEQGGISASRLEARAFGESMPIDSNTTTSGRENNRRVEIDFIAE